MRHLQDRTNWWLTELFVVEPESEESDEEDDEHEEIDGGSNDKEDEDLIVIDTDNEEDSKIRKAKHRTRKRKRQTRQDSESDSDSDNQSDASSEDDSFTINAGWHQPCERYSFQMDVGHPFIAHLFGVPANLNIEREIGSKKWIEARKQEHQQKLAENAEAQQRIELSKKEKKRREIGEKASSGTPKKTNSRAPNTPPPRPATKTGTPTRPQTKAAMKEGAKRLEREETKKRREEDARRAEELYFKLVENQETRIRELKAKEERVEVYKCVVSMIIYGSGIFPGGSAMPGPDMGFIDGCETDGLMNGYVSALISKKRRLAEGRRKNKSPFEEALEEALAGYGWDVSRGVKWARLVLK